RVLAVATGSTVGTAPTLPAFSGHLCSPAIGENDVRRAALEVLVLAYAKKKEESIAAGLLPV
ncbi:unnamed protein product, partial [Pylaiella littoralis]